MPRCIVADRHLEPEAADELEILHGERMAASRALLSAAFMGI